MNNGRVFICGDTHGGQIGDAKKLTSKNWKEGTTLTKQDYLIILGDFGYIWNVNEPNKEELYNYRWFNEKPWTTLFLDGNHENFNRIERLPEVNMFGGIVGKLTDSIYHLKRGEVYTINGIKLFTFGGGTSIDKIDRIEYISWWSQEDPTDAEFKHGLETLKAHNNKVDIILSHDCSTRIYELFDFPKYSQGSQLQRYFDVLEKDVDYNAWYFGHYHMDYMLDNKHGVLYNTVQELTKEGCGLK